MFQEKKRQKFQFFTFIDRIFVFLPLFLLRFYQKTFSPDHSEMGKSTPFRGCRFYPSCSEYAIQTFEKKGFFFGILKILWRLLRCHPWSRGGVDEVK